MRWAHAAWPARGAHGQVDEDRVGGVGDEDRQRAKRGRPGSEPDRVDAVFAAGAEPGRAALKVDAALPAVPVDEPDAALQEPAPLAGRRRARREPACAGQGIGGGLRCVVTDEDGDVTCGRPPGCREPLGMERAGVRAG